MGARRRHGLVFDRSRRALLGAMGAAVLASVLPAAPAAAQTLDADIERLVSQARIGSATVGVSVIDDSGREIVKVRSDTPLIPASNMKLLTSGAALLTLGPEFQFSTDVIVAGDRVILRGSGDPGLADPDLLSASDPPLTVSGVLDAMAAAVRKRGVSRVSEVIADDRVFDREYVHPTWPTNQLDKRYCAAVAGLNAHVNTIAVFPSPSAQGPGGPPTAMVQPDASWIDVDTRGARTVSQGQNSAWLVRVDDHTRFRLLGEVRRPGTEPIRVTIQNPPLFAARLLADRLARLGVAVPGDRRSAATLAARLAEPSEDLPTGEVVASIRTPLAEVLRRCNSDSYNLYAECLLKRVGHQLTREPGSWSNGASVVRMLVSERLGPEHAARTTVVDGSGMSRENRVSAGTLARWLSHLASQPTVADAFTSSLATPGLGTLKARFATTKPRNTLHAKSGYLDRVRSLSGYLVTPDGSRQVVFSIIINGGDTPEQAQAAARLVEDIVLRVDQWLTQQGRGSP